MILSHFLYKIYVKQLKMADFSILCQICQFPNTTMIHSTVSISTLFNDFHIFTEFTGGSGGHFRGPFC